MTTDYAELLRQYERQLEEILARFRGDRDGIHIAPGDDARLKQSVLELMDIFADRRGMERYAAALSAAFQAGIENFLGSPSYRSVEDILTIVRSGRTKIERGLRTPNSAMYGIHPVIAERCEKLIDAGSLPEAVELSFKLVRDRLRKLTTYETSSDAFGKGKLYIQGAAAPHVDEDFNAGAKFLMMAIDRFRNEKSHTSEGNIHDREHAYQYLAISSLALRFLDRAEVDPQK